MKNSFHLGIAHHIRAMKHARMVRHHDGRGHIGSNPQNAVTSKALARRTVFRRAKRMSNSAANRCSPFGTRLSMWAYVEQTYYSGCMPEDFDLT